jgi:3-oxoacyl-[acyl-carrier protein] reductase
MFGTLIDDTALAIWRHPSMDFEIAGKTALVCGGSAGLGYACAEALAMEGAHVVLVARNSERLAQAAEQLSSASGLQQRTVLADVATELGRATILSACPTTDILITNAGGPAPKDFRELSISDWNEALASNFLASVEMIRMYVDGMAARGWGRIVNITSVTARMPIEKLDRSTAARLAVAGYVSGVARQVATTGVTINNLLPGVFETDRARKIGATDTLAEQAPMRRPGRPPEFGATCAFLCSKQASYITAQNILVDGGLAYVTI